MEKNVIVIFECIWTYQLTAVNVSLLPNNTQLVGTDLSIYNRSVTTHHSSHNASLLGQALGCQILALVCPHTLKSNKILALSSNLLCTPLMKQTIQKASQFVLST